MPPKRTLSFHGTFWQGFVRLSIGHQATAAAVATILTATPVALLTWALVTYAQRTNPSTCAGKDRLLSVGFEGNSDFYGLGIRLGVYLQWMASLIANPLLKSERMSMAEGYLTFSLAVAVAVLLQVFQPECTLTAEIIVVLNIFWGGTLLVMVPFVRLLADIRRTGLCLALLPLILSMLPVSAWFWLRLALHGEVDFVPTPGGTYFFLLARVIPTHLQAASWFMAVLCLILCIIPVFSTLCLFLVLFLDWMGRRPPEWGHAEDRKRTQSVVWGRLKGLIGRWARLQQEEPTNNKW